MCEFQGDIHNSNVFASFAIYAFSQKRRDLNPFPDQGL